jgi:hypothetical protein
MKCSLYPIVITSLARRYTHIATGYPICRECLRGGLAVKYGKTLAEIIDDSTVLFACCLCQDTQEFSDLLALPSLEHKPTSTRMSAWRVSL